MLDLQRLGMSKASTVQSTSTHHGEQSFYSHTNIALSRYSGSPIRPILNGSKSGDMMQHSGVLFFVVSISPMSSPGALQVLCWLCLGHGAVAFLQKL